MRILYLVLIFVMSLDVKKLFIGWVKAFMSGAGPHFPKFHFDIVRIHTLMRCSDIVEYNIVGDTKAALLRCIPFISKVKNGERHHLNWAIIELSKISKPTV